MKVVVAVFALVLVLSGCDWTMFRGNAAHTGFNIESTIGIGNVATLQEKWTGATGDDVVSSPAVSGERVFVGSNDNRLYAFSANGTTGCGGTPLACQPLWKSAGLGGDVTSSPAVAGGRVFVASVGQKLVALDAAGSTGCSGSPTQCNPLWTYAFTQDQYNSPAVVNGTVYINDNGSEALLHAVDAATGMAQWTSIVIDTISSSPHDWASPAVAGGLAYVVIPQTVSGVGLFAFDATGNSGCSGSPKTCAPLWTASYDELTGTASPAVANGVVFVIDAANTLRAYDAAGVKNCTGSAPAKCSPLWTAPHAGITSPAVANGKVYVATSDGHVNAFDANGATNCTTTAPIECSPLWTTTPSVGTIAHSSPAVANGVVYIGSSTGLHAFNAATGGASLWDSATGGMQESSPTIANGIVYIGSTDNSIHAYALP